MNKPGVDATRLTRQPRIITNAVHDDFPSILDAVEVVLDHLPDWTGDEQEKVLWWLRSSADFVRLNLTGPGSRAISGDAESLAGERELHRPRLHLAA